MDPVKDVDVISPCWVVMHDGARYRCEIPIGLCGDARSLGYSFLSVGATGQTETVNWNDISYFENIQNPSRRLQK